MKTYTITQAQLDTSPAYKYPGVTEPGEYTYSEADNQFRPVQPQASSQFDFDRTGLGIGGLGRHQEPPLTPTAEQIGRVRRQEQQALRCRRCRQSELDGAMFTTDSSNGLCDDCYE